MKLSDELLAHAQAASVQGAKLSGQALAAMARQARKMEEESEKLLEQVQMHMQMIKARQPIHDLITKKSLLILMGILIVSNSLPAAEPPPIAPATEASDPPALTAAEAPKVTAYVTSYAIGLRLSKETGKPLLTFVGPRRTDPEDVDGYITAWEEKLNGIKPGTVMVSLYHQGTHLGYPVPPDGLTKEKLDAQVALIRKHQTQNRSVYTYIDPFARTLPPGFATPYCGPSG